MPGSPAARPTPTSTCSDPANCGKLAGLTGVSTLTVRSLLGAGGKRLALVLAVLLDQEAPQGLGAPGSVA